MGKKNKYTIENFKEKLNNVYCIDATLGMKKIPNKSIDLTVTSPPYDTIRMYDGYKFNFKSIAQQLYRITKDGGIVVWIVADETYDGDESGTSFRQALYFKKIGFNLHDTMIWNKGGFTATGALKVRYAQVFEYMFILSKGKIKTFNPISDRRNKSASRKISGTIRQKDGSFKKQSNIGQMYGPFSVRFNIWDINSCVSKKDRNGHPAPFPEDLAGDHIKSWSNEFDIVLDPMCGSGTTLKMAKILRRNFIGFEISKMYVEISKQRLEKVPSIDNRLL